MDSINNINNDKKNDNNSLTDSESSYIIEEEIVEYEISDSEEDVSTKKSQKQNENNDKRQQSDFFETALQMKEEEMKTNQDNIRSINNDEIPQPRALKNLRDEFNDSNVSGSFKNVSDSMENIKTRLSSTHLNDDAYNVLFIFELNKTINFYLHLFFLKIVI